MRNLKKGIFYTFSHTLNLGYIIYYRITPRKQPNKLLYR
jgi:hypothetical protein